VCAEKRIKLNSHATQFDELAKYLEIGIVIHYLLVLKAAQVDVDFF